MKIRSGNLALNVQNSNKNVPISVLCTEPEYKKEIFSIHLHFKQTVVVRDLPEGSPAPQIPFPNLLHPTILNQSSCAIYKNKTLFPLDIVRRDVSTKTSEYIEQNKQRRATQ